MEAFARTRQPARLPWSLKRLRREHAKTYNSHLQSYLTFCKIHKPPIDPAPDTLSFYVVFMSHHIKPQSVAPYLSGICSGLEPFYPTVRSIRQHQVVTRSLAGVKKLKGGSINRCEPLTDSHLRQVLTLFTLSTTTHDNLLFSAIVFISFHAPMQLGELTWPQDPQLRSWRKVTFRHSVRFVSPTHVSFHLPYHKADCLY